MKILKTYKYKLYSSKKNKYLVNQIVIASRIYNHCIALHKMYFRLTGKSLNKYKLQKHITKLKDKPKYECWYLLNSQAIQDITDRIDKAYKLFFRNLKHKIKCAPPSFKSYKKYKSFTLKQAGFKIIKYNQIKIGSKIFKYSKSRDFQGEICTVSVKRDTLGDLYIHLTVEEELNPNPTMTGKKAGFDFGLKTFLTVSDMSRIESPDFFKSNLNEIRLASRNLSSKKKGSNNRKKASLNLAKIHKSIFNKRKDYFFKLAKSLTSTYDYLFFETLNIKGMQQLWGMKVSDLSFYSFLKILEYYCLKTGKTIHYINRFYPSSKECSDCGYIYKELSLKERTWICPKCRKEHDRDLNAAINIEREGASSLGLGNVRPELNRLFLLESRISRLKVGVCQ